jgi:hypothetical protein
MTASTTSTTSNTPVTILATLTVNGAPVPLGSVQFQDNGKPMAVVPVVGLNPAAGALAGTAKLVTRLTPGTHTILGIYSGAGNLLHPTGNVTPAITVTAAPQLTATKLTAVNNTTIPADYDVTATVLAEGSTVPTGTVTLNEPSLSATLNSIALNPAQAALGVSPELPAASGSQNGGIVSGDFNGDGIADFAAASDSATDATDGLPGQWRRNLPNQRGFGGQHGSDADRSQHSDHGRLQRRRHHRYRDDLRQRQWRGCDAGQRRRHLQAGASPAYHSASGKPVCVSGRYCHGGLQRRRD